MADGSVADFGNRGVVGERLSDCPLHRAENLIFSLEANLGLGGVRVHVNVVVGDGDVEDGDRVSALGHEAVVGLLYGVGDRAVLHPAPVDEEAYVCAVGAVESRRAYESGHRRFGNLAVGGDLEHRFGYPPTVDGGHGVAEVAASRS